VREALPRAAPKLLAPELLRSAVIVGGGKARNATLETLRREGYQGPGTMIEWFDERTGARASSHRASSETGSVVP
jgi:hypothetical protein